MLFSRFRVGSGGFRLVPGSSGGSGWFRAVPGRFCHLHTPQKRYSQWWKLYNLCKKTNTIIYCATTTFCSCEKKAWKKFRLLSDSNPWPLRYWCSALTNWTNKPTGNRLLNSFILDQWKDDDKVINIWKSLPSPCTEAFQALLVNAFQSCIQDKQPGDA